MNSIKQMYSLRRVYETTKNEQGTVYVLRLSDRFVDLGERELRLYAKLAEWLPSNHDCATLERKLGLDSAATERLAARFAESGLLVERAKIPEKLTGEAFHRDVFSRVLPTWLSEAFSHPYWQRMMSGNGSKRLFDGWMIELYHYTLNANRHMPLAVAHTREKPIKTLRSKHYAEEWNHYHYFMKSLKALGYSNGEVASSVPLPATLALSNFMRQAAREDILCYSICSAVLEGTTIDRSTFNPYYEKATELYGIPRAAITPIYDHLDLDVKYGHSDLFLEILETVDVLTSERAARVLEYGHQLVELIWLWTDNIEKYYDNGQNAVPRHGFDPFLD